MSKSSATFVSPIQSQALTMSPAHPHTVSAVQEDDDDDICPVCDGECTCTTNPSPKKPTAVLKIRLPAMRLKTSAAPMMSAVALAGNTPIVPKRRGRPPKSLTAARPYKAQPLRRKPPLKPTRRPFTAASAKRKRAVSTSSSSELSNIEADDIPSHFPTFVSASALSSASSSDSDSGSDGFDTDSSIEAEEENFILAEERARVRRELLGSNNNAPNKRRDNWIIRPRRTSVGDPSDVDMDDSTADSDDDSDEDGDEKTDDDDDDADVEEEEETDSRRGCTSMVTGWSDDEESSLDADLFFANLADSSCSSSSEDEIEANTNILDPDVLGEALSRLPNVEDLPFQVTEGWDGQVVFTNGLTDDNQGSLDVAFDARAIQLMAESSTSASEEQDADMNVWQEEADDDDDGGDTTDEDLVGPDDLPNEKAMRIFNLPFAASLSSLNPMSAFRRTMIVERAPSEEMDEDGKRLGGPRQGLFDLTEEKELKTVVVDEERKDIPSPHPRSRLRPRRFGIGSLPQFLLPSSPATTLITSPEPELRGLAGPIELDDVLDSSFLDGPTSSSEHSATTPTTHEHMRHLTRWDVVSVGAFRKKDVEHTSESEYGGVMKSSPLAAMLWQNKLGMTDGEPLKKSRKEARKERKLMKKTASTPLFYGKGKGKSVGKVWHHHHAHHSNGKSGRAGSSQRNFSTGAGGSSPIP